MRSIHTPRLFTVLLVGLPLLGGCSSTTSDALSNYADIVSASYADSLTAAQDMDKAIDDFVASPDAAGLTAAQDAWKASREPYLQTEVYRFYDGPIDNAEDGPEGLLNAWPLDENYIDYVLNTDGTFNEGGIVNDTTVEITAANLESLNEKDGDANIATGYHAIEFLLWGQDTSDTGPGDRAYTDYVTGEGGTHANQDRRGLYLGVASDMLVGHLQGLVDAWDSAGTDNYRAEFLAAEPNEGLRRVMSGMIMLAGFETGSERLQPALDNKSQEDEHSCFSDNTHRDMVQDVQGVMNVWKGSYTKLDGSTIEGTGIYDVINEADAALATSIDGKLTAALDAAKALQAPFDQEIAEGNTEGNDRVQATITALLDLETELQDAFKLLELTIPPRE